MPALALLLWLALLWSLAPLAFPLARRLWTLQAGDGEARPLDSLGAWPDGGWAAGRLLALVLWTLGAFWAGHAHLPVRLGWILLLPALALSALVWKQNWRELSGDLKRHRRAIVRVDGVFLLAFAAFLLLRCLWPDTAGTNGEKPMDIALASACARADSLPPANPYLAGTRLGGYYYLGHLQAALVSTTVGIPMRWGYNFACATLPALCASIALPLAVFLCGSWKRGGFATLILLGAGTLEPLRQWAERNEAGFRAWPLSQWSERSLDYFSTSRVTPNPIHNAGEVNYAINEYPFFTSTYGDLHAHFFAQPIALLAMSLGAALFLSRRATARTRRLGVVRILLTGCVLAALVVTNTWDVPAYWMLAALCLFAPCREPRRLASGRAQAADVPLSKSARRRQRRAELEGERARAQVLEAPILAEEEARCLPSGTLLGFLALASVVMALLAAPYIRNLHTNAFPPSPLDLPATPPIAWLLMWGPFTVAWSLALWRAWREDEGFHFRAAWLLVPVGLWLALKLAPEGSKSFNWLRMDPPRSDTPYKFSYGWGANEGGADYFAPLALLTLLILSLRGALRSDSARFAFLCRLAVCGLVPLLWSELTWAGFLDRSPTGMTYHRQDTVFKFGLQGWFLLGLASIASALGPRHFEDGSRARGAWRSWPWALRGAFGIALGVMFVSSALCLWGRGLIKSSEKMRDMEGQPGSKLSKLLLTIHAPDAWAHLAEPEVEAATWMASQARDGDSLLEPSKAPDKDDSDYTDYSRYVHATGIPSIVGPTSHTFQWGAGKRDADAVWGMVNGRKDQVQAFYQSQGTLLRDPKWREEWKREFGLRFIVLGEMERRAYGDSSVAALIASAPGTRAFGAPDDPRRVVVVDLG